MKWIIAFSLLCLTSCSNSIEKYWTVVKMFGKKIDFNVNMQANILGKDTTCTDVFNKEYKILVCVNPHGCSSCQLPLYGWKQLIDTLNDEKLAFIFVINVSDFSLFEKMEQTNKFSYPVFYDPDAKFVAQNALSKTKTVQVLLLDKHNKIIGIGDPVKSQSIYEYYRHVIKGDG